MKAVAKIQLRLGKDTHPNAAMTMPTSVTQIRGLGLCLDLKIPINSRMAMFLNPERKLREHFMTMLLRTR
ncbi:hypothetical protein CVV68_18630 [Arthrobacter livingstonensis]|uniref:Uncharacterized protein n=1 Tax=Arthrobacter livingstonensis TaxID=670078 RepID=A0A2V5L1Y3_9MICC|nr:hypothetical protein CVV68_18630 [Arthrobacter livingstonensis]